MDSHLENYFGFKRHLNVLEFNEVNSNISGNNNYKWRLQKSMLCDGSLCYHIAFPLVKEYLVSIFQAGNIWYYNGFYFTTQINIVYFLLNFYGDIRIV